MNNNDAVIEFLLNQLRQQLTNNQYKQQCEDLVHEVQSLKNQLRDASEQIKELHMALARATGDVEAYKLICSGGGISGDHTPSKPLPGCTKCGVTKPEECEHEWYWYNRWVK